MIKEDGLTLVEILRKIYKLKLSQGYDKKMKVKTLVGIFEKNLQVKVKLKQYLRTCRNYQVVKT